MYPAANRKQCAEARRLVERADQRGDRLVTCYTDERGDVRMSIETQAGMIRWRIWRDGAAEAV